MSARPARPHRISQLWLDFTSAAAGAISSDRGPSALEPAPGDSAEELQEKCREWLTQLGLSGVTKLVRVHWNRRLHSTAGFARYPSWRIELNPLLKNFEGQVERTLKHELAHLVAYHRAGRKRIKPHGPEWRQACAELGIAGEKAQHHLDLPRRNVARKLLYVCPSCDTEVRRMRKFRQPAACLECCRKYNRGQYDERFRLKLVKEPSST